MSHQHFMCQKCDMIGRADLEDEHVCNKIQKRYPEDSYKCKDCDKVYKRLSYLEKHIKESHTQVSTEQLNDNFQNIISLKIPNLLNSHQLGVHGNSQLDFEEVVGGSALKTQKSKKSANKNSSGKSDLEQNPVVIIDTTIKNNIYAPVVSNNNNCKGSNSKDKQNDFNQKDLKDFQIEKPSSVNQDSSTILTNNDLFINKNDKNIHTYSHKIINELSARKKNKRSRDMMIDTGLDIEDDPTKLYPILSEDYSKVDDNLIENEIQNYSNGKDIQDKGNKLDFYMSDMNILSWKKNRNSEDFTVDEQHQQPKLNTEFLENQMSNNNDYMNKSVEIIKDDNIFSQKMKLSKNLFDGATGRLATGFELEDSGSKGIFNQQNEANKKIPGSKKKPDWNFNESVEFLCSVDGCNKTFKQKRYLTQHERIHKKDLQVNTKDNQILNEFEDKKQTKLAKILKKIDNSKGFLEPQAKITKNANTKCLSLNPQLGKKSQPCGDSDEYSDDEMIIQNDMESQREDVVYSNYSQKKNSDMNIDLFNDEFIDIIKGTKLLKTE